MKTLQTQPEGCGYRIAIKIKYSNKAKGKIL
jgi:hypothetical protein